MLASASPPCRPQRPNRMRGDHPARFLAFRRQIDHNACKRLDRPANACVLVVRRRRVGAGVGPDGRGVRRRRQMSALANAAAIFPTWCSSAPSNAGVIERCGDWDEFLGCRPALVARRRSSPPAAWPATRPGPLPPPPCRPCSRASLIASSSESRSSWSSFSPVSSSIRTRRWRSVFGWMTSARALSTTPAAGGGSGPAGGADPADSLAIDG
jgi:hypothetical protein